MSDIFLSYAREDRERIGPLVRGLEAQGWSVFWDQTIPVGKTWLPAIGTKLESCGCVLVVWTADSIASDWVQQEAEEGKSRGILVPVLLDEVLAPIGLRHLQAAHLETWQGDASAAPFQTLLSAVKMVLEQKAIEQTASIEPSRPKPTPPVAARTYDPIRMSNTLVASMIVQSAMVSGFVGLMLRGPAHEYWTLAALPAALALVTAYLGLKCKSRPAITSGILGAVTTVVAVSPFVVKLYTGEHAYIDEYRDTFRWRSFTHTVYVYVLCLAMLACALYTVILEKPSWNVQSYVIAIVLNAFAY